MIKIRAHHLLCISRFHNSHNDGWYSKEYENNFKSIYQTIKKNPETNIKIIKKCDDICKKCPHKSGSICNKRPKINYWIDIMDNKVLRKLEVKENSVHKAEDIINETISKINNKDLRGICKGCGYLNSCLNVKA